MQEYTVTTDSKHGRGPNSSSKAASWKASLPLGKLAGGNKRCVGAKHSARVQPRLATGALPEGSAPLTSLLSGGEQTNRGGDLSTPPKRSHIRDKGTREWFPFKHFSGSKKGRRAEASNKPQSPEPVPPSPPLQDGGDSHLEGLSQTRRLADESGFEGCLLHNPNSHLPQEVPQVQLPREDIPVQLPPLRSLFGTMGLYQDPQTSNSHSETVGGTVDSIHRRHTNPGGDQGTSLRGNSSPDIPTGKSGFHNQPEKVCNGTRSDNRVFGLDDQYPIDDFEPPSEQNEKDSRRSSKNGEPSDCVGERALPPPGENEPYSKRDPSSSPILSQPPNEPGRGFERGRAVLRINSDPLPRQQGGAGMVGQPDEELEREKSPEEGDRPDDRLGCFSDGMGSILSAPEDWGSMVRRREVDAHKLSGIAGSNSGDPDICKRPERLSVLLRIDNTTAVAYINNLGGRVSRELLRLAKTLWMWCLERNIHIIAQHLPGVLNHIADAESRIMRDRSDWKLDPRLFQKIDQALGPIEVDLFASRLTTQCQVYFSWQPDPYAAATDAFLQDWSGKKGYANPPWCLIGRVLSLVQTQRAQVALIAPVWKTQPWYPLLLTLLTECPYLINVDIPAVYQEQSTLNPQLAVWNISGRDTETRSFQRKLPHSCSNHGEKRPISLTTHSLGDGIAGVVSGKLIPFRVL